MDNGLHFISGLPRSGSTLLAAILRQNPRLHAGMSSPVGPLFQRLLGAMGPRNEFSVFMLPEQRENVLRGLFDSYYKDIHPTKIVFDTGRLWCAKMAAIVRLFPEARVIVCVRELAWIMDSFERILRRSPLVTSRMFQPRDAATIYTRVNALAAPMGTVGFPWNSVQEAFYGEHADRLIVIDYEALTRDPKRAIDFIYEKLDLEPFAHDFDNVTYEDGGQVDAQLGVPGLHMVGRKVGFVERPTILPPDLFERFSGRNFWRRPGANPRNVAVLLPEGDRRRRPAYPGVRGVPVGRRMPFAGA
ncbi:MAG TPA: sulfotransferase [Stellaceae bacterium]|nr:sulfotransferase [Stellaceae bacterium]